MLVWSVNDVLSARWTPFCLEINKSVDADTFREIRLLLVSHYPIDQMILACV